MLIYRSISGCWLSFTQEHRWPLICLGISTRVEEGAYSPLLPNVTVLWDLLLCCHGKSQKILCEPSHPGGFSQRMLFAEPLCLPFLNFVYFKGNLIWTLDSFTLKSSKDSFVRVYLAPKMSHKLLL